MTSVSPGARAIDPALQAALEAHRAGRWQEARQAYEAVLAQRPDDPEALLLLAQLLRQTGDSSAAVAALERLLTVSPSCAPGHLVLGQILRASGRLPEAYRCYSEALRCDPGHAEAHFSLGTLHCERGQWREAAQRFREVIRLAPNYAEAHCNLGTALQECGAFDAALACFHTAIRLKPDYADAHYNLGNAYKEMGQAGLAIGSPDPLLLDQAIAGYRRALALQPDLAEAHLNLALALLLKGAFREGWEEYEWRWRSPSRRSELRHVGTPPWRGEPLEGRTLLLYFEQGLGDVIQFARFAPLLSRLNARVLLEVEAPVHQLLRASFPGIPTFLRDEPLPAFDYQCPLLDVPRVLGVDLATIPAEIPYLFAEPERVARWRERLGVGRARRIGIVWAGSSTHRYDRNRSVPLQALVPLLDAPGTEFFTLQKGPAAEQLLQSPARDRIVDHSGLLETFADTAALVACLDLVITVDTAVAHLASAMGKPTWMLTPFAPDWRWLLEREDTPWYPTLRLFRQQRPDDWARVIGRVRAELATCGGGN